MTANIPYGSIICSQHKDKLKKGDVICKWDPYNAVIISEFEGILEFNNLLKELHIEKKLMSKLDLQKL